MGMDIIGLDPKLTKERPEINFLTADAEEKVNYWNEIDAWEKANPGYYFRANLWSWRPINAIIDFVNSKDKLEIDTSGFGHNSGHGITDPEKCNQLADSIEKYLRLDNKIQESEIIYLNLGMWVADDNSFSVDKDLQEELDIQYPIGTVLYSSVITRNGLAKPAWGTAITHIESFIEFLRNCNGFEIH